MKQLTFQQYIHSTSYHMLEQTKSGLSWHAPVIANRNMDVILDADGLRITFAGNCRLEIQPTFTESHFLRLSAVAVYVSEQAAKVPILAWHPRCLRLITENRVFATFVLCKGKPVDVMGTNVNAKHGSVQQDPSQPSRLYFNAIVAWLEYEGAPNG